MMYNNYYMPYHSYGFGLGFNIFSFILTVLFWWIVVMLVIKLIKWIASGHNHHCDCPECCHRDNFSKSSEGDEEYVDEDNSNIAIVKERYAKGEINKKEFEQIKKDLA